MGLTLRQLDLYRFIASYQAASGGWASPTMRECAAALGSDSKATAHRLLICLAERGYVRRISGRQRAIEVLRPLPAVIDPAGHPLVFIPIPAVRGCGKGLAADASVSPTHSGRGAARRPGGADAASPATLNAV